MKLRIETSETSEGVLLTVNGDVDMETSPGLRDEIKKRVKKKPGSLKVHMAEVPYIDSSGIAVLIEGMRWCKKHGVDYSLIDVSESVEGVLSMSRLLGVFTVEKS